MDTMMFWIQYQRLFRLDTGFSGENLPALLQVLPLPQAAWEGTCTPFGQASSAAFVLPKSMWPKTKEIEVDVPKKTARTSLL